MTARPAAGALIPDILAVREDHSDVPARPGRGGSSPCDVLSVYLEGGPRYRLGEHTYEFKPPAAILIAEGTLDADMQEGKVRGIFALFRGRGLVRPGPNGRGHVRVSLSGNALAAPCLRQMAPAEAERVAHSLRELMAVRGAGQVARMRRLALLLTAIAEYCDADTRSGSGGVHREAARLRRMIERRAFEDAPLAEVYGELDLSASHAETLFKSGYGTTPVAYRTRLRLGRARELLVSSSLNVAQAARAVGFSDPLYFSRVFRAAFGQAPSDLIRDFERARR